MEGKRPEQDENASLVTGLLEEAYASRVNNLKKSIDLAERALILSRKTGEKVLVGKSLNQLALFNMIRGEYPRSAMMSEEALKYFEGTGDEKGIAEAKYNIAGIYYKTDNYHLGLVYLIDCLAIYRKYNDYHNQSRVYKSLGTIYEYFGDLKNAVKSYRNAVSTARLAGDLNLESNAYNPLSGIFLKLGKVEKARKMIEKAIAMKTSTQDTRGMAFSLYGRAKVFAKTKNFEEAERDFNASIAIHRDMGERLGIGMAYHKLGVLYAERGWTKMAKDAVKKGLELSHLYNVVIIKFKCNYLLYKIYKEEGDTVKALAYLEQYLKEKEAVINTQTLKVIENYELIAKMESLEKEARVQREKAEIIEKKNRAEESARIRQEFLSTMSHEIRTPLNAVITITSLLKEKSDVEEQHLLNSLQFASNNLLLLINDILDFTKLDSGKVALELRSASLRALLEGIRSTYESMAREKGVALKLEIDAACFDYYALDSIKLSQILGNLISNAIKFTEDGAVTLAVDKLSGDENKDSLLFKVTDTGVGIPRHNFEEIFETFSQPKSITTRKHGGSGLGLAIVKKLAELYGSVITVESEVGEGSAFSFELTLKKSKIPAKAPETRSDKLTGKTVLLAEDNKVNAMVAIKLLTNWGMSAELAENGEKAIEKAQSRTFDYILMDIHMPDMNGFDATVQIRSNPNPNQATPIFALTADITAENQEEYTGYFNGFLRKPIEIDKLYEALVIAGRND
ncbi:MAG TPA: ATP-binding protein [Bacteroidia bacterium]|nr:ATP-binding protein [Bacteroidia bacterium]